MNMIDGSLVKFLLDKMAEVKVELEKLLDNDLDRLDKREDFRIQELLIELGKCFYQVSLYEDLENLLK